MKQWNNETIKYFINAIIIIVFFNLPNLTQAANNNIVISEIQTYGASAKDEFIRLYNPTDSIIDISSWRLTKKTSSGAESNLVSSFTENSTIPANSEFLIVHKTDYVGTEIPNATYSGTSYSIADDNTIILKDGYGVEIDKVGFGSAIDYESAPAQNPERGASIKRNNNQDTNNNKNDFMADALTLNTGESEKLSETYIPPPAPSYEKGKKLAKFGDVVINEAMPNPDEEKEWIELYNTTQEEINLNDWSILDGAGKIYSLKEIIQPESFLVIEINSRLNNSGDAIYLTDSNNTLIHSLIYGEWTNSQINAPEKGQSIAREDNDSYQITSLSTKSAPNQFFQNNTPIIIEGSQISSSTAENNIEKIKSALSISELLPNPAGSDSEEWIELHNTANEELDIGGIYIDDDEGGSAPYQIPLGTSILPNNFLIFKRDKTKLALNNDTDSARLLDKNKSEFFVIDYEGGGEGLSYAFIDNKWQWTSSQTPLAKNISNETPPLSVSKGRLGGVLDGVSKATNYLTGIVIVPPNLFSSQIMYINGKQLYMFNYDWPDLKIGDKIEVWGEPSSYYGEPRLKLKNKNSIKIISRENNILPLELSTQEFDMEAVGSLISLTGVVIETTASKIIIESEAQEIPIIKKASVSFPKINEGDLLKITGILSIYKDDFRVIPRSETDIIIEGSAKPIKPLEKKRNYLYYLISVALASPIIGVAIRRRRNVATKNS